MKLKSFVLIEKDNQYLLIKETSSKWKNKWYLPGGKAKGNETPELAALREVNEEAGCNVNLEGIFFMKCKKSFFDNSLTVFYSGSVAGEASIKQIADKHSIEAKWFSYHEIIHLPLRGNLLKLFAVYHNSSVIPVKNLRTFV